MATRPSTVDELAALLERENQLTQPEPSANKPITVPPIRLPTPEQKYRQLAAKLRSAGDESQAQEFEKMAEQMEENTAKKTELDAKHAREPAQKPPKASTRADKKHKESQSSRDIRKATEQQDREARARKAEGKAQQIMAENEKRRSALIAEKMAKLQLNPPAAVSGSSGELAPVKAPKQQQWATCPQCSVNIRQKDVVNHRCPSDAPAAQRLECSAVLPPITQLKKQTSTANDATLHEPGPLTRRCEADAAAKKKSEEEEAGCGDKKRHKDDRKKRHKEDDSTGAKRSKISTLKGQGRALAELQIPSLAKHTKNHNKDRRRGHQRAS